MPTWGWLIIVGSAAIAGGLVAIGLLMLWLAKGIRW